MPLKTCSKSRRQFLVGAGKVALALPVLPSLLHASVVKAQQEKRFLVSFYTPHGGAKPHNMWPSGGRISGGTPISAFSGHNGTLHTLQPENGLLSKVLSGPKLTPALAAKMNLIQGLDIPFYLAHNEGLLGNFARNDGNGDDGKAVQGTRRPTVDALVAHAPNFYTQSDPMRERVMYAGRVFQGYSFYFSNAAARTGDIVRGGLITDPRTLFSNIFIESSGGNDPAPVDNGDARKKRIADRVLANYRSLRQSNRRLSSEDRRRLDDHIARIDEIESRFMTMEQVVPTTCDTSQGPPGGLRVGNQDEARRFYQAVNDVVVTAFLCGTSRVATLPGHATFYNYSGDWHQNIAHRAESDDNAQNIITDAYQYFFREVFLDLIDKLNRANIGGKTLLDQSLAWWVQESGPITHACDSLPVVMAGSAGGYFKTGYLADYRDKSVSIKGSNFRYAGITYYQWLDNVLRAMQVDRSFYGSYSQVPGYGVSLIGNPYFGSPGGAFYQPAINASGNKLPGITT